MIIIAGELHVAPERRGAYLDAVAEVNRLARAAPGCLDFVQAADPVDDGRINVYERWESDADLLAFRESGGPEPELPPILGADVRRYRVSSVEAP
ncbi:putative quinol monooxygenase [Actinoplanes sp. G11-F43]|uniref:putative quinol monooxygenase n=1 Tax=Actinoplanes sp. G11-F43 TaxID=3424130 RepID=UPI003D3449FD